MPMSVGRMLPSALSLPAVSFCWLTLISFLRSFSEIAIGRVRGGVGATGDAGVDLAERDLVGDVDRRLQTGAARLLQVAGRGLGRQLGAEHRLAGQVEVAAVLEHGAGDDLAEALTLEAEAGGQAVDGRGEHLLVGGAGVDGVRPGERDPVAAEDGDAAGCGVCRHGGSRALRRGENKRCEGQITIGGR